MRTGRRERTDRVGERGQAGSERERIGRVGEERREQ